MKSKYRGQASRSNIMFIGERAEENEKTFGLPEGVTAIWEGTTCVWKRLDQFGNTTELDWRGAGQALPRGSAPVAFGDFFICGQEWSKEEVLLYAKIYGMRREDEVCIFERVIRKNDESTSKSE
jgi:hypothetical protein